MQGKTQLPGFLTQSRKGAKAQRQANESCLRLGGFAPWREILTELAKFSHPPLETCFPREEVRR